MSQTITATFEDGVLKPSQPLDLPAHAEVRVTIELVEENAQADKEKKLTALENLWRNSKVHSEHLTRDQLHERR